MAQNTTGRKLVEGTKYDDNKLPWHLFSFDAMEETVKVLQQGAKKYEERNWEKGIAYSRVFRALLGHLYDWWRWNNIDEEWGLHHLAHAMCCLMFLLHFEMNPDKYEEFDDRPHPDD